MKPASVNRKLEALRRFCRWAYAARKLRTDVAASLKLKRVPRGTRPKGLTAGEIQALLRAAGQSRKSLAPRNYALVQLLLQAGLRVSEVAVLRIGDLEIRERHGKVHVRGKGEKERDVPLNATARRALQTYLHDRQNAGADAAVFLSESGARLSVRSIQSLVSELARRARITRIPVSAHTLRHSFALGYLKQNPGKLLELATLLGHESLDTTAVYALPSEDLQRDLFQQAGNLQHQPERVYGADDLGAQTPDGPAALRDGNTPAKRRSFSSVVTRCRLQT